MLEISGSLFRFCRRVVIKRPIPIKFRPKGFHFSPAGHGQIQILSLRTCLNGPFFGDFNKFDLSRVLFACCGLFWTKLYLTWFLSVVFCGHGPACSLGSHRQWHPRTVFLYCLADQSESLIGVMSSCGFCGSVAPKGCVKTLDKGSCKEVMKFNPVEDFYRNQSPPWVQCYEICKKSSPLWLWAGSHCWPKCEFLRSAL